MADLSPGSCVGPRAGPPQRRDHCTPPLPTLPHPHRPRSPPVAEEAAWVPQTPAPRRVEAGAARLRLELLFFSGRQEEREERLEVRKGHTDVCVSQGWFACIRRKEKNGPCWML